MAQVKAKVFVKALKKAGFEAVKGGGKGSHAKWARGNEVVIFPTHGKEVPFYVVKQARALGVNV